MKMKEKARNILTFYCNSFFFSKNCINYPLFSVCRKINISSKKYRLFLVKKKGIYAITRKKFLFTKKVDFSMIFCLFHSFHKNKQKTMNIGKIYVLLKIFLNDVFLTFLGVLTAF